MKSNLSETEKIFEFMKGYLAETEKNTQHEYYFKTNKIAKKKIHLTRLIRDDIMLLVMREGLEWIVNRQQI